MPRRARLLLPGVPLHLIQRGNNRMQKRGQIYFPVPFVRCAANRFLRLR